MQWKGLQRKFVLEVPVCHVTESFLNFWNFELLEYVTELQYLCM